MFHAHSQGGACRNAPWRNTAALLAVAAFLLAAASPLFAEAPAGTPTPTPERTKADYVQHELKALELLENIPAETRAKAQEAYKQALEELRIADDWQAKTKTYQTARQTAPKELEDVRALLDKPSIEPTAEAPANATLDDLKQKLATIEAAHAAAETELTTLQARVRRRVDRVDEVRVLDAAAKARLDEIKEQLAELPEALDPVTRANRAVLLCKRTKILAEREAYDEELPSYEATRELLRAKLDLATRQVNLTAKQEQLWKDLVAEHSRQDAERKASDARWAVTTARPEVLPLAKENERLAELRNGAAGPAQLAKTAEREAAAINAERTKLKSQFEHIQKVAELTDAIGSLLQRQREELPDLGFHRGQVKARRAEVANVKLQLIELESKRSELADIDPQVRSVISAFQPPLEGEERAEIESAVRELLDTRRDYLDALIADYNKYFNVLAMALDKSQQELIAETEEYADFIDERILWIRSAPAIGGDDWPGATKAVAWLAKTDHWWAVARALWRDAAAYPLLYLMVGCCAAGLIAARGRTRRRVQQIGRLVMAQDVASMRPTVDALSLSLLMAALWPGLLGFLAWRLAAYAEESSFVKATSFALQVSALVVLMTEVFRQLCRKKGLADAHFGWPGERLSRLRRNLLLLLATSLPLTFVVALVYQQDDATYNVSLGRFAFVVAAGLLSIFAWRALRTVRSSPEAERRDAERPSWQRNGRVLGYRLGVTVPLALAGIAAAGYYFTAVQLAWRLQATLWLLLALVITMSFLLRWLQVTRQQLADARAARATSAVVLHEDDGYGHLSKMDAQTRRLLSSVFVLALTIGVWLIWVDVLPALKFLDQWKLWSYADAVAATAVPADGKTPVAAVSIDAMHWVTLGDVVLTIVILFMTTVAARNLPGLLEIAWLQKMPLDAGGRYAVATIARYVILLVGIIPALRVLGIGWANVQWLAAAMTVGLGFGLQEIFANFISGLIILFERPMRVGDTVTVGGVTGTVSRIRSRATTITDGDNRELIVPNKEFITGQLVNWTLSDRVLRVVLKVGISHGSDTELATRLLLEAAHRHPLTLKHPAPSAVFTNFGESALEFELRVFVAGPEDVLAVRHELNTTVNVAFHNAGIEVSLPHRDGTPRKLSPALALIDPGVLSSEVRHEQRQSA